MLVAAAEMDLGRLEASPSPRPRAPGTPGLVRRCGAGEEGRIAEGLRESPARNSSIDGSNDLSNDLN